MTDRHPLRQSMVDELANGLARSTGWLLVRLDADGRPLDGENSDAALVHWAEVRVHGEALGCLALARPDPSRNPLKLAEAPTTLIDSFAVIVSRSLEDQRADRGHGEELASLIEITRLLTSTVGPTRILQIICEAASHALDAKGSMVLLLDEAQQTLRIAAEHQLGQMLLDLPPIALNDSLIDLEALAGDPVVVESVGSDPRCQSWPMRLRAEPGGALCVGLVGRTGKLGILSVFADDTTNFTIHTMRLLLAIANQAALGLEQARLERDSKIKRHLTGEMQAASEIQLALLPRRVPTFPNLDLAVHFAPCEQIGGDLYDFIAIDDDNLGIAVGDASGKGITGALMMATVRGGLHAYVEEVFPIAELVHRLNLTVFRATKGEYYMTLFYGVLNLRTMEFSYSNAGHNAPLWLHESQWVELEGGGAFLGADPHCQYHVSRIHLTRGDLIVFFSDGLSDAMNGKSDRFGANRIRDAVYPLRRDPAARIIAGIMAAVDEFCEATPLRDDLTVVVLRVP